MCRMPRSPSASTTPAVTKGWSTYRAIRQTPPVAWFRAKVKCAKCGACGQRIDVRPNWNEQPGMPDSWEGRPAWET